MINTLSIKSLNDVWSKSGRQLITMNWGNVGELCLEVYLGPTDSGLYKM